MYKLETHLHTKGSSPCGQVEIKRIAEKYHGHGYKGIIVTNHIMKHVFEDCYPAGTPKQKAERYIGFYKRTQDECAKYGIRVFLGAEINPVGRVHQNGHSPLEEYLVYGLEEAFLYENPKLYNLTQKEMFKLFDGAGFLMYQSHPFRTDGTDKACTRGNPEFMHGVEVFNGHPGHKSYNEDALAFAKKHGLKTLSGSDFHDDFHYYGETVTGGVIIPEKVKTVKTLVNYLKNREPKLIRGS